jgi:hypothetical protein
MWIIFLCAIWFTLFVGGICLPLEMEMPLHRGPPTKYGWIWPLAYPICAWSSGFSPLDSMIDFFRFVPCWTCGLPSDYEIFLVLISAFCVPLNLNLVFWMFQGKRSEPSPLALTWIGVSPKNTWSSPHADHCTGASASLEGSSALLDI